MNIEKQNIIKEYSYHSLRSIMLAGAVLFGYGVITEWAKAHRYGAGLIINHALELSPSQAVDFHWVMFSLYTVVTAFILLLLLSNLFAPKRILLTQSGLVMPKSLFSSDEIVIPYSSITSLVLKKITTQHPLRTRAREQCFLWLMMFDGKKIVSSQKFSSKQDFDEFFGLLSSRVNTKNVITHKGEVLL